MVSWRKPSECDQVFLPTNSSVARCRLHRNRNNLTQNISHFDARLTVCVWIVTLVHAIALRNSRNIVGSIGGTSYATITVHSDPTLNTGHFLTDFGMKYVLRGMSVCTSSRIVRRRGAISATVVYKYLSGIVDPHPQSYRSN